MTDQISPNSAKNLNIMYGGDNKKIDNHIELENAFANLWKLSKKEQVIALKQLGWSTLIGLIINLNIKLHDAESKETSLKTTSFKPIFIFNGKNFSMVPRYENKITPANSSQDEIKNTLGNMNTLAIVINSKYSLGLEKLSITKLTIDHLRDEVDVQNYQKAKISIHFSTSSRWDGHLLLHKNGLIEKFIRYPGEEWKETSNWPRK